MSLFIEIKGKCGAGKTTVMNIMAKALEKEGINVKCDDAVFPYSFSRKRVNNDMDNRCVHISVLES